MSNEEYSFLNEFDQTAEEIGKKTITTEELDEWAKKWETAWAEYEKVKEVASAAFVKFEEIEGQFMEAMRQAGKQKYFVEGIGTIGFKKTMNVPVPKTIEQKQQLAKYLEQKGGKTLFWDKFSINHNTLKSFYNAEFKEFESYEENAGKQFMIPGLEAPTVKEGIQVLSKDKAKQ